ncbi:MAG: ATP-binding protein [Treponema sp.]|nr:ATP-binding protein [Treponema sp.]MEE3435840.1 ATP-binding protein [Treponema sp.]
MQDQDKKIRWDVASAMSAVYSTVYNSKLKVRQTVKYKLAIQRLCQLYNLSEQQVWILCVACENYIEDDEETTIKGLGAVLRVPALMIMGWKADIDNLKDRGFFENDWARDRFRPVGEFCNSLFTNTLFVPRPKKAIDDIAFVKIFYARCKNRKDNDMDQVEIQREMKKFEDAHEKLGVVTRAKAEKLEMTSRFILYCLADDVKDNVDSSLDLTIERLFDGSECFDIALKMMNGDHELFQKGLVEFSKMGNYSDAEITLTDKGKKVAFGDKAFLFEDTLDDKLLIKTDKIKAKRLFYSWQNQKEIDRLKNALDDDTLKEIQARLGAEGLPIGVAVLLYGEPGTGKTESVLQIARETGRHVVHVDISESKSAWFGESEKRVKKIFTSYRHACEACEKRGEKIPILLFNEADAIISKRKDSNAGNCAQTENTIQNIILEELENLNGIFIATTNLVANLDSAFERRFLFKVKFENPSIESKTFIWRDKLSWLDERQAKTFATDYDFSGGQIDNIVRKIAMNEVITGKRPAISEIHEMCRNEKIDGQSAARKIGFGSGM